MSRPGCVFSPQIKSYKKKNVLNKNKILHLFFDPIFQRPMNTQKYRDFETNHQTSDKFHGTVLTTISFSLIFITHSEKSQPDFQELLRLILETGIGKIHTQRISMQTLTSRSGRGSLSSVCAYRFCRTSVCKQAKNGTHAFFAPKRLCSKLPKPLRTVFAKKEPL